MSVCKLIILAVVATPFVGGFAWPITASGQPDLNTPPTLPDPFNVHAMALPAGGIEVRWDYEEVANGRPIDGFVVTRFTSPEGANKTTHEEAGTARSWTDQGVEAKKTYYYRVIARRGVEQSRPVGFARATTFGGFVIKTPAAGERVRSLTPEVDWTPAAGGGPERRYEVVVNEKEEPKVTVFKAEGLPLNHTFESIEAGRLHRNREYVLQVTAVDPAGVRTPAANGPISFSTPAPLLLGLMQENHVSLRRAFEGDDASKSALFSYTDKALVEIDKKTGRQNTAHTESADFQFSLSWTPPLTDDTGAYSFRATGLLNAEGKLSNQNFDSDTAMRFRGGVDLQWFSPGQFISASRLIAVVKHEADQDYDTQKMMAEITARVTVPELAIGLAKDIVPKQVRAIWTPSLITEYGKTIDQVASSAERDDTVLRLIGRVQARLSFPSFARDALNVNDVAFFADNKSYYLPLEDDDFHNYLQAGFEVKFTDNVSIALQYKIGEDAPNFLKTETYSLSLGVQF
jgi:hypothetical protein